MIQKVILAPMITLTLLALPRENVHEIPYISYSVQTVKQQEPDELLEMAEKVKEMWEQETYVTDADYNLLLRVCMSECGGKYGEPMKGKIAVVETILNRHDMGYDSISTIVHNAYSIEDNGEPDETCVKAVDSALKKRRFPKNMIYFRTKHYHGFGTPYKKIGNHYFSLKEE